MLTRRLLIPALLLAHAGLLLIALRERPVAAEPPVQIITVTEIAAAAPPSLPIEIKLFPVSATVDAPALAAPEAAAEPSLPTGAVQTGTGCDLSGAVQTRLRSSPEVTAALQRMPRNARSVADAVMLWDGHWIDAADVGGSGALDPIRTAVAAAVRAAPASCRDALVAGPRLLIVAGATGNQVLAFGSGQWTWSQLLGG